MIDLKSALESVKYNTGALGNQQQDQDQQGSQNSGVLANILKQIMPAISGGAVPPVA